MAPPPTEPAPRSPAAARLALDARTLEVRFTASLGPLRMRGSFGALRGSIVLPCRASPAGAADEAGSIDVDVVAESVNTGLAMRDRHLRGASFLQCRDYPLVSFRSARMHQEGDALVVAGTLTMRGVAREVVAHATLAPATSAVTSAAGEDALVIASAALSIPIRRHGVGIPRGGDVLNPIFLLIGDHVQVTLRLTLPARCIPASLLSARAR